MMFPFKARIQLGLFLLLASPCLIAQAPSSSQTANPAPAAQEASTPANSSASQANGVAPGAYVIGRDDILSINVWKEKELTQSIPVRSDGKISLPLAGEVVAAGLTPMQLQQRLTQKLRAYITDPVVTVIVEKVNSKNFNVLGQVAKPGTYSITVAATVMDGIAAAGGFRDFAKKKDIYVLRKNPDGTQSRIRFNYKDFIKGKNPSQNIRLQPHDTIIVP